MVKKPAEKRPKASNKEQEWVEVPSRKNLQKKKRKKAEKTPKKNSRPRSEAVLIKPGEGMSYASILRELKRASTLRNLAPQSRESGRRAPKTCWWN